MRVCSYAAVIDLILVLLLSGGGMIPFVLRGGLLIGLRGTFHPPSTMIFLLRDSNGLLIASNLMGDRWAKLSGSSEGDIPPNMRIVGQFLILPKWSSLGMFTQCTLTVNWVDPAARPVEGASREELDQALSDFIDDWEESDGESNWITEGWRLALKAGQTHWTYINWWCVVHDVLASAAWISAFAIWPRAKRERAYERGYNDYFGPTCSACGYPREGLATETCPECGRVNSMPEILRSAMAPASDAAKG